MKICQKCGGTLYWLDFYWLSINAFYKLSTDTLLTLHWLSTDSYWLSTDFYWLSNDYLLTSTESLLISTDSLWTASDLLCVWTTENCWEHSNAICCMDWPGHRPLVQLEHLDLPQFILIYLELPQFTLIHLNIPWFTSNYLNFPWIPQFTLTHHNLS